MNANSPLPQGQPGHSEIDLGTYLEIMIENRWLIAAIAAICLVLGGLYAFMATPIYRANIMLQVEDNSDSAGAGNLVSNVSSLFQVKSVTAGEIEILRSRLVVSKAVDNLRLYINASPHRFPLIGGWIARHNDGLPQPGLFGMGGYAWGDESIDVTRFDVPKDMEGQPFTLIALANGRYRLAGKALDKPMEGQVGQSAVFHTADGDIQLTVAGIRAEPGIAFDLERQSRLGIIKSIQGQLDIQELGKQQSGVIGASLDGANPVLISRIMNAIGAEYVQQNVDLKSAEAAKSLKFLDVELPKMKGSLEEAEDRFSAYRKRTGTFDVSTEGKLTLQQAVEAQAQMLTLEQKRADLLTRFAPAHPSIIAIDEQIAALKKLIGNVDARIEGLPQTEQEVVRLQRDVQVNNELYLAMLQSSEQLSLLKAGKVGSVRIVDTAAIPEVPVKPVRLLVLVISLLGGLLAGIAAAIAKNMLFGGITDPHEVEQYTGLSVYATVPLSEAQRELSKKIRAKSHDVSVLAMAHPHEPAIESLRSLRTALQFAMLEARNNIVILTGPSPGVGKSFISANFAAVLASTGKRVLLIDADVRKGYLHQYFGQQRDGGLSELLSGSRELTTAIRRTSVPNLDFISTGAFPPNPSELLLSSRLGDMLQQCTTRYDYVILDAPPVLAVTDAAILASLAGVAFLVALAGVTKTGEIAESARRLAQSGVHVRGVLLNGMKPHSGRYGYGSKYGNYRYVAYRYAPEKE